MFASPSLDVGETAPHLMDRALDSWMEPWQIPRIRLGIAHASEQWPSVTSDGAVAGDLESLGEVVLGRRIRADERSGPQPNPRILMPGTRHENWDCGIQFLCGSGPRFSYHLIFDVAVPTQTISRRPSPLTSATSRPEAAISPSSRGIRFHLACVESTQS